MDNVYFFIIWQFSLLFSPYEIYVLNEQNKTYSHNWQHYIYFPLDLGKQADIIFCPNLRYYVTAWHNVQF